MADQASSLLRLGTESAILAAAHRSRTGDLTVVAVSGRRRSVRREHVNQPIKFRRLSQLLSFSIEHLVSGLAFVCSVGTLLFKPPTRAAALRAVASS